jgi:hypothetical protein
MKTCDLRYNGLMRYLGWIIALVVLCVQLGAQGSTQDLAKDFTWDELKRVQQEERKDFLDAQKNAINMMGEQQRGAMDALKSESVTNAHDIRELSKQLSEERVVINKAHSDERNKLAQTHADERSAFKRNLK